jgi:tetratricopeptide (TPR) repeat protein
MTPSSRPHAAARPLAVAALTALLGACALGTLQVDRQAKAPELSGYGTATLTIVNATPEAGRRFAQGMAQAYAFNEAEAVREFKAALAQDPACAMCAWGVAYQLGPNINDTDRGDLSEALRNVDYALKHAQGLPERDRALIDALALRYGHASSARDAAVLAAPVCGAKVKEKADPLDIAYARRMRELADRFPDDPDVLSMYAEAEMIATRDDWWDPVTGAPGGRIGEVADRLEAALVKHPEHTGLNHYLIHAVDALPVAARAQQAADRLGRLAPSSPHLLHMPSHTYVWLGRYADASRVNVEALAADETLATDLRAQGFSVSKDWRGHDGTFLWYAALMEGRGDVALATARASAARAKGDGFFSEFTRSRPLLTLLRLERWDEAIAEPADGGKKGVSSMLGHYAHGVAFARTGRSKEAAEALAQLEPEATGLIAKHTSTGYMDKMLRSLAEWSLETLRAGRWPRRRGAGAPGQRTRQGQGCRRCRAARAGCGRAPHARRHAAQGRQVA